jgi:hypothetical protein
MRVKHNIMGFPVIKHYTRKIHGGMEVKIHALLTLTLEIRNFFLSNCFTT